MSRTYLVVKESKHDRHEHSKHHHEDKVQVTAEHKGHEVEYEFQYEQAANALMSAEGYINYVKKHGYHFTDALAEHVSKMMKNADKTTHSWTTAQVKKAFEGMDLAIPTDVTWGDVAYTANMYYADFYPDVLKTEGECLKAAYRIAHDVDGYEGMIFCRWTPDAIGKAISINWDKFV